MNKKVEAMLKSQVYVKKLDDRVRDLTYQAFFESNKKEKDKLIKERDHYLNLYNEYFKYFEDRHQFMKQ